MSVKKAIKDSTVVALPFLVGLSIYSILGMSVFGVFGKEEAHQFFNSYHTRYLDETFRYVTEIGHGTVPIFVFLILLLVRYSWAIAVGVSSLVAGLVVQTLKHSVFAGDHRPAMFFQDGGLPSIDGIILMHHHSFPSGHSAVALCVCFLLAFMANKKWATYFLLFLALMAAFSRVYISQHFIQDTVAGAWIGLILAYTGYIFILHPATQNRASKLNKRFWPT